MRLHEALRSPSFSDLIYSLPEITNMNARERHARMRASQGAAQSGHPNVPDGVGYVPREDFCDPMQKVVDSRGEVEVESSASRSHGAPIPRKEPIMLLKLKGLNKKNTTAMYSGSHGAIRIGLSCFADKQAPAELLIDDLVLAKAAKEPKVKLTKEQRAALPKPTAAELVRRAEERLAKMKAKLEAQANEL